MKPNIGISETNRERTTQLLSSVLANEMMLYIKTRKSHWNLAGESFMELLIDEIAERIGELGGKGIGTVNEFVKFSSIKAHVSKYLPSKETLHELLIAHEWIIIQLRKDIEECGTKNRDSETADFLTGLKEKHETTSWILRRCIN